MSIKKGEDSPSEEYYKKRGWSIVSLKTAKDCLLLAWKATKLPYLSSLAGIGKTAIVTQAAEEIGYDLEHFYCSHIGADEIRGLFAPGTDGKTFTILAHKRIYAALMRVMNNEAKGLVIFLDEWNRVPDKDTVNALFAMISSYSIPGVDFSTLKDRIHFAAAGNPSIEGYSSEEYDLDPAVIRRCLPYAITKRGVKDFIENARLKQFHKLVIDFVYHNMDMLYDEAESNTGRKFPCPASYEDCSLLLYAAGDENIGSSYPLEILLGAAIGQDAARGMLGFWINQDLMLKPQDLLSQEWEDTEEILQEAQDSGKVSLLQNLLHAVFMHLIEEKDFNFSNEGSIKKLIRFLAWLPREMQVGWHEKMTADTVSETEAENIKALNKALRDSDLYNSHYKKLAAEVRALAEKARSA